jgi:hypothetical protein
MLGNPLPTKLDAGAVTVAGKPVIGNVPNWDGLPPKEQQAKIISRAGDFSRATQGPGCPGRNPGLPTLSHGQGRISPRVDLPAGAT